MLECVAGLRCVREVVLGEAVLELLCGSVAKGGIGARSILRATVIGGPAFFEFKNMSRIPHVPISTNAAAAAAAAQRHAGDIDLGFASVTGSELRATV